MRINILIEPLTTDEGTQYFFAETQILKQLREWNCSPQEVPAYQHADAVRYAEEVKADLSYYSFRRLLEAPKEQAEILLYIPDYHPAALMAKLKWGGIQDEA